MTDFDALPGEIRNARKFEVEFDLKARESHQSSHSPAMVKPKPGDISIVVKTGTLLMWYDRCD